MVDMRATARVPLVAPRVKGPIVIATLLSAAVAYAEPPAEAAARAYDRGARASRAGDDRAAARAFAEADAIAPHAATLVQALRAALDADDFVLVRELLARAETRESSPELARVVAEAERALPPAPAAPTKPTLGALSLEGPVECTFSGGARTRWLPPGARTLDVRCPEARRETTVDVALGTTRPLRVDYRARRGPPLWVPVALVGGAFVSVAFGILRGAFAGDRAADLLAEHCAEAGSNLCRTHAASGHAAQVQANVGFALGGALGAAAIGTWVWHRGASLTVGAAPQRASLQLSVPWN